MALKTMLKHVLIDKEMEAQELAALIQADPGQVSRWATGKRVPTLERAIQIATVLETSVEELWKRV